MERTRKARFLVLNEDNSSVFSSPIQKHYWFEVLEGDDKGMRVRIPCLEHEYDDMEIHSQVTELSEGTIVEAILERDGPDSMWRPIEIDVVSQGN